VLVGLNVYSVELSFEVTVIITLAALAALCREMSARPAAEFMRFALP